MDINVLSDNLSKIKANILANCMDKNNPPKLIAVTKTETVETTNLLARLNHFDIAENRSKTLLEKLPNLNKNFNIHYIGALQTNKIKYIINNVALLHSLDREHLAEALDERAKKENVHIPCLLQVNIANEAQKGGFSKEEALSFLKKASKYSNVNIKGLMAIMPFIDSQIELNGYFKSMYQLFSYLREMSFKNVDMQELSMGMSNDYMLAAANGATMLRIGSAIFKN